MCRPQLPRGRLIVNTIIQLAIVGEFKKLVIFLSLFSLKYPKCNFLARL